MKISELINMLNGCLEEGDRDVGVVISGEDCRVFGEFTHRIHDGKSLYLVAHESEKPEFIC